MTKEELIKTKTTISNFKSINDEMKDKLYGLCDMLIDVSESLPRLRESVRKMQEDYGNITEPEIVNRIKELKEQVERSEKVHETNTNQLIDILFKILINELFVA